MRIKSTITDSPYSAAAWYLLAAFVVPVEIWLLWKKNHSFSEQMRWWIQKSKFGSVLVVFWGWLLYHFTIEPIIRKTYIYLRKLVK